jgi:hypothetical protein
LGVVHVPKELAERPVALEAAMPQFVSGGVHLPEQKRRVHGQQ